MQEKVKVSKACRMQNYLSRYTEIFSRNTWSIKWCTCCNSWQKRKDFRANLCDFWKCHTPQRSNPTNAEWNLWSVFFFSFLWKVKVAESLGCQNSQKETKKATATGAATSSHTQAALSRAHKHILEGGLKTCTVWLKKHKCKVVDCTRWTPSAFKWRKQDVFLASGAAAFLRS